MRHVRVTEQTPAQFREDAGAAKALLEDVTGRRCSAIAPRAIRSASATCGRSTCSRTAATCTARACIPIRHDIYGMPERAALLVPRRRRAAARDSGDDGRVFGRKWPGGGGGYFRLLPYRLSRWAVRRVNRRRRCRRCSISIRGRSIPQQPRIDECRLALEFPPLLESAPHGVAPRSGCWATFAGTAWIASSCSARSKRRRRPPVRSPSGRPADGRQSVSGGVRARSCARSRIAHGARRGCRGGRMGRYVSAHAEASAYHSYAWRSVVRTVFGHETHYLAVRDQDGHSRRAAAGATARARCSATSSSRCRTSTTAACLRRIARRRAKRCCSAALNSLARSACRTSSCGIARTGSRRWPARTDKVAMMLRLPRGCGRARQELCARSCARRSSGRCARARSACSAALELLDEFYAVFAENMRDLGTPVYAKAFFRTILADVSGAHLDRDRCACAASRSRRRCCSTIATPSRFPGPPRSSASTSSASTCSCTGTSCSARRAAAAEVFDFGRSTIDSGTFRFKQPVGRRAAAAALALLAGATAASCRGINPDNPKYRFAVAAWRKLPLAVANWLGPHIVGNCRRSPRRMCRSDSNVTESSRLQAIVACAVHRS